MNIQEAINLLDQVCQSYRGTRQEHVALQTALNTVRAEVEKNKAEQESRKEKKV